jgi:hypothetical protein
MHLSPLQRALTALGLDKRRRADRRVLEGLVFPWLLAQAHWHRVLFVGCAWYTQRYHALFANKDYWTLEADPRAARHGARQHITGRLEQLPALMAPESLDVIVCNGVVGWGLDAPEAVEAAVIACHATLRRGGLLLLGWNETVRRKCAVLSQARALGRFAPLQCPPLNASVMHTGSINRHVYAFYEKRA